MRYIFTAILFFSVPSISIATQVLGEKNGDNFPHMKKDATKSANVSPMSSRLKKDEYMMLKEFETETGKVSIKLPFGINVPQNLFKKHDSEDIPYILEEEAARLFNKVGDKKNSALYTIASLWAENIDGNFISDLDFIHPGIVKKIRNIDNIENLQSVLQQLEDK